jgi:hypothetical protein
MSMRTFVVRVLTAGFMMAASAGMNAANQWAGGLADALRERPGDPTLILVENDAGVRVADGHARPVFKGAPAPDRQVTYVGNSFRIAGPDGRTLAEVALRRPGEPAWVWSPHAYSAVYLRDLGLTVRGLSAGEARRTGLPRDEAVVVHAVDLDCPKTCPGAVRRLEPGDVIARVGGRPATPLELRATQARGIPLDLRVLPLGPRLVASTRF